MVKKPKLVIDSSRTNFSHYFSEIIKYRDLLITLTVRDFKVRYAQTALGFIWVLIQPLATLAVLVIVFDKTLHINTFGVPYPLYAMAGMMLWTYFGYVLNQSGNSIVSSQSIISKVYFPRLVIPVSKAIVGLIDFLVAFLILSGMFLAYGFPVSIKIFFAPVFLLLSMFASLGAGILFSSFTVRYRDFQYVIPFLLQVGFYITPIAYPTSFVSAKLKWLYFMNPMAGIIEGFRWSLFGSGQLDPFCYLSVAVSFLMFIIGVSTFIRTESEMADLV